MSWVCGMTGWEVGCSTLVSSFGSWTVEKHENVRKVSESRCGRQGRLEAY
jgi:hypothetical protein